MFACLTGQWHSNAKLVLQGMSLVPAVTELILAELLYLQYDNPSRPVYMYINSAGVTVSCSLISPCNTAFKMQHPCAHFVVRL